MSFSKAQDLLRLAQMAASRRGGVSLEDICTEFRVSHRTAQRMTEAPLGRRTSRFLLMIVAFGVHRRGGSLIAAPDARVLAQAGEGEETLHAELDLAEIERVARESADSMRDLVELLGGRHRGAGSDWLEVLQGMAERLLRGIELECRLTGESWVREPDLESRREIYLFCKEVLHNIARHAKADSVKFRLRPTTGGLRVEISDNGRGFDPEHVKTGHGLRNLRDRATGLHATMDLESTPGKGTLVTLDVPRGRRWRKPKKKNQ